MLEKRGLGGGGWFRFGMTTIPGLDLDPKLFFQIRYYIVIKNMLESYSIGKNSPNSNVFTGMGRNRLGIWLKKLVTKLILP